MIKIIDQIDNLLQSSPEREYSTKEILKIIKCSRPSAVNALQQLIHNEKVTVRQEHLYGNIIQKYYRTSAKNVIPEVPTAPDFPIATQHFLWGEIATSLRQFASEATYLAAIIEEKIASDDYK